MQAIKAIDYVRCVRGGSQSHILRAEDGHAYVVKLQGNPQCNRVLANELLATRLASAIGLPVPTPGIVEVDSEFIRSHSQLRFEVGGRAYEPTAGLQFGSRLIVANEIHDYLPSNTAIHRPRIYAGILAFDKWTGQADGRQAVYHRNKRQRGFRATFIDFGYAFNADEWRMVDSPYRGTAGRREVYGHISGWQDFEPWLSRIETFKAEDMQAAATDIPTEWYGERHELDTLLDALVERRGLVRDCITAFRESSANPFPKWTDDQPRVSIPNIALGFA